MLYEHSLHISGTAFSGGPQGQGWQKSEVSSPVLVSVQVYAHSSESTIAMQKS